ncbi:ribosome biogenesis GTPase Der [Candidatus Erwinia haradaeae]|uniref:GTPase Der n=1 Tax=Candidatus Erwinia haradaeae TaxID=1922217 RepID=A0A451D4N1_9GAMM|nr:ribosome biogenesis GTPase Der [Candidatus Erwinia haradaeae]VFP80598.1 GTPase Der [Candidatus Erwinia haradaeae]
MVPVVALIGRPNVGKSTLFNRLTRRRDALVANFPGVTRDRQYGHSYISGCIFICIDTSGIDTSGINDRNKDISSQMLQQSKTALTEAHIVLFLVDARAGLMPEDIIVAQYLRLSQKSTFVVANKIAGLNVPSAIAEFWSLGLGEVYPIDASHGEGVTSLIKLALLPYINTRVNNRGQKLKDEPHNKTIQQNLVKTANLKKCKNKNYRYSLGMQSIHTDAYSINLPIKIAIVGRPNVGKSTLTNALLGKQRVIVGDLPGTTRDSVHIPMVHKNRQYILIDTAGVRQRGKLTESIEKFSVIKTLQAIENANVVLLVLDAKEGVSDQDLSILRFILNSGRSLIIIVNKWDILSNSFRHKVRKMIDSRISFINYARVHFISAITSSGLLPLFNSITEAYACATRQIHTSMLTRIMQQATKDHQPPLVTTRRAKLKYAHIGGYNPPVIVIHGNQVQNLPDSYKRYLINYFRRSLNITGTPIRVQFKEAKNPYVEKSKNLFYRKYQKK